MVTDEKLIQLTYDKNDYSVSGYHPLWCPGCGDFAILKAMKNALFELQLDPQDTILVPGIGCSSKMMDAINTYGLHTIHGRSLPIASGVKLANHNINVIAFGGDGDMVGIGGNHFMHACRRNLNITVVIPNNQTYGLTTGQASPTSDLGYKTKTSPGGVVDQPVSIAGLAVNSGATFVARSSSADNAHLQKMIEAGVKHQGMSVIEVMQFCITFNRINTPDYYEPRLYDINDTDYDHRDYNSAILKSHQWGDKIPYGILYEGSRPSYEASFPQLQGKSLVEKRPTQPRDISSMFSDDS